MQQSNIDLVSPKLLELLVCPQCHGELAGNHEENVLICQDLGCQLAYPVTEVGVPVMLIDQAVRMYEEDQN